MSRIRLRFSKLAKARPTLRRIGLILVAFVGWVATLDYGFGRVLSQHVHLFIVSSIHDVISLLCIVYLFILLDRRERYRVKHKDEQLRESLDRSTSILNQIQDGYYETDLLGRVTLCNDAMCKILGVHTNALLGMSIRRLVNPIAAREWIELAQTVVKTGDAVVAHVWKHERRDGKTMYLEASVSPIQDTEGQCIGFRGIIRDVTSRVESKRKLEESEEQLRTLINTIPDIVIFKDVEGHWLGANQAVLNLYGLGPDFDYLRKSREEVAAASEAYGHIYKQHEASSNLALRSRQPIQEETSITGADGVTRTYDVTKVAVLAKGSDPIGVVTVARDVTRQRETVKELQASVSAHQAALREIERLNRQNELLLNSAVEAIFGLDMDGTIVFCNRATTEMSGYQVEELIGKPVHQVLHHAGVDGELCTSEECPLQKGFNDEQVQSVSNCWFWRKDLSVFPAEYVASPIVDDGKFTGKVVILRDITERKQAEEFAAKSGKLEIVGQLAAGIAHEIRNPLTALSGFIQLLETQIKTNPQYFEIMRSELKRIEGIVNEFLVLARPSVEQFALRDCQVILENLVALMNTQAIMNNIEIVADFDANVPPILCEENRLKQVFINLLKNALESMPSGGVIRVQMEQLNQSRLVVRIVDQGCGIPRSNIERLGEPFFTTKETGTGLGLMISDRIVKAHGGDIRIQSAPNQGTTVEVILPISTNPSYSLDNRPGSTAQTTRMA